LLERGDEVLGGLHVLAVVKGDRLGVRTSGGSAASGQHAAAGGQDGGGRHPAGAAPHDAAPGQNALTCWLAVATASSSVPALPPAAKNSWIARARRAI